MDFRAKLQHILENRSKVVVVGLGISGIETALFFRRAGHSVLAVERMSQEEYFGRSKYSHRLNELQSAGVETKFGIDGHNVPAVLDGISLAIVSPGIAADAPIKRALADCGVESINELELGIELYRELRSSPAIVVTGSNGKSTTVSLIHHILCAAKVDSVLCGNVGIPVVTNLGRDVEQDEDDVTARMLVVEASSYQLEVCTLIKPKVGVLLNVSENHLERHKTLEGYLAAKAKLFANQDEQDLALLNHDDPLVCGLAQRLRARVLYFGAVQHAKKGVDGVFIDYQPDCGVDRLLVRLPEGREEYDLRRSSLLGMHNRYNLAAGVLAARILGLPPAIVASAADSFCPLEHRLEFLSSRGKRLVVNDSKATTVASSLAAVRCLLERFRGRKVSLLLGGLAKTGSWEPLMTFLASVRQQLEPVICFGQDGPMLADECRRNNVPAKIFRTLRDAVHAATIQSSENSVILLSPGCASFDEFSDFEERGVKFRQYIEEEEWSSK